MGASWSFLEIMVLFSQKKLWWKCIDPLNILGPSTLQDPKTKVSFVLNYLLNLLLGCQGS